MKKTAVNVVKFAVTFGILYLMFKKFQIGFDDISTAISTSKAEWFAVSILTQVAAITFSIFRWRVLLVAQDLNVPISHVIKTYLVGRFLGTFTPTGLGLEAYKAYDIARYTQRGAPSVTVVFVEKFLTLLALSILMLITLPMVQLNTAFIGVFFIFFLVVLLILLILIFKASILLSIVRILPFTDKTEGPARKAVESFQTFKNRKGSMGMAIIFGVLVYISLFSTFFTNGMALRIGGAQPGELCTIPSSEETKEALKNMNIQWIKQDDAENEKLEVFLTDSERESLNAKEINMTLVPDDKYTKKGLGLGDVLTVGPLTQIATMIPLSIAGIGLREGAFVGLLKSKGVWVAQRTVLAATMWYFVSISVNIFGAIIFLTRRTDYHTKISKEEFQKVTRT